ncbi:MAG: hypothetical protein HY326_11785 [Chloroflexi bacterium]|nr:hypothetical protein [Chloroflexota bacterium]
MRIPISLMEEDVQQVVARIDAIILELEELRRRILITQPAPERNITGRLYGALGHGSWSEYDPDLDWIRFSLS